MTTMLNPYATIEAADLGHDIRWDTVGDSMRNGTCRQCGMTVSIAQPKEGLQEAHGEALRRACPGRGELPDSERLAAPMRTLP